MIKFFIVIYLLFIILSCGYPDLDEVPDFKNTKFSDDELLEYCSISNRDKKDIDKCVNDYKS
tara:strand:- start:432 stop:617 length:186 start_codon:yes stop_codon:yes gene_type:complete